MSDIERSHPRELVAEYALGVLPESEAARVRAFLETDAEAMAEYEEMAKVARMLPFAADDSEPSVDLRPGLLDRIRQEPVSITTAMDRRERQERSNRRLSWWAPLSAAAAGLLIIAAGVGGFLAGQDGDDSSELEAQVSTQEQLLSAVARGTHELAQASEGDVAVSVIRSPGSTAAYTYVQGMPELASGQAYQSWFIGAGESAEPGPVFTQDSGGVWLEADHELGAYSAMAFTVEDEDGSDTPSQTPFLVVPLQRAAANR